MNSGHLFDLSGISFSYEKERIFDGLTISIKKGEKIAIKGESGSGKTTLFRLLLGFEAPEHGTISYNGSGYNEDVIHSVRREVAWLPQDLNLGSGKTSELMNFIFDFQANIRQRPERSTILDTLRDLGLEADILESTFSDLSTGQRQRVGLACCLLLDRKVVLLDEPTSALDLGSKRKMADLVLNNNRTVISTSHDPWWVEKCDRIIELKNLS